MTKQAAGQMVTSLSRLNWGATTDPRDGRARRRIDHPRFEVLLAGLEVFELEAELRKRSVVSARTLQQRRPEPSLSRSSTTSARRERPRGEV